MKDTGVCIFLGENYQQFFTYKIHQLNLLHARNLICAKIWVFSGSAVLELLSEIVEEIVRFLAYNFE